MSAMARSIIIRAPVSDVFEFAMDPGRFVAAIPDFATRATVLTPDGVGSSTHAYTHGLGIHFEGTVEYTQVVANERIVAEASFPGEHPTWTFTFDPLDGGTRLTMRAEWHVRAPLVGRAMDAIKAREHGSMAEQWLEEVRSRVEPAADPDVPETRGRDSDGEPEAVRVHDHDRAGRTGGTGMATTHRRSIHVDAPVAKVFDYVRDPRNTFAVICETPTSRIDRHVRSELTDVTITPDCGVGTTWSFRARLLLYRFEATYTRQEYVRNERIVDGNTAAGLSMAFDFEPDASGTTLTMAWSVSSKATLLGTAWDRIYWDGDRDLDSMLSSVKSAVEA